MKRAVALALVACCAGCGGDKAAKPAFRGTELSPAVAAPGFTLRGQDGRAVSLAANRGHFVVVAFLYTHCPDVCPVIAGNLNQTLKTAVGRRAGLRVLAVSVDPRGDTPAAVRHYVREHRLVPAFRYLIGNRTRLARVWRAFHIATMRGQNGVIAHSTYEILIDPTGRERVIWNSSARTSDFVHDLGLLAESA
jgi:protein SCO1/2